MPDGLSWEFGEDALEKDGELLNKSLIPARAQNDKKPINKHGTDVLNVDLYEPLMSATLVRVMSFPATPSRCQFGPSQWLLVWARGKVWKHCKAIM